MPLNLSNRDQNSGHLFYQRRLRAAITRFSVRMKHDDRKQQAALALSMAFVLLGCGWMALLHFMKPAGLVGQAAIVGNRDTGTVYARIDGRLYPALNLTSARLATGSPSSPTWVRAEEIAKLPTGPLIGIPGIPDSPAVQGNPVSAWSVCDTNPGGGGAGGPVVTSIAGTLGPAASRGGPVRVRTLAAAGAAINIIKLINIITIMHIMNSARTDAAAGGGMRSPGADVGGFGIQCVPRIARFAPAPPCAAAMQA